jgi:predicted metal-binding membrane protein
MESAVDPVESPPQAQERIFLMSAALMFAASATLTILWCGSMSTMPGMPMPGGWTMSMAWMRMPGQTWFQVAASFLGMWVLMMVAMMLPSLVPMLRRYRLAIGGNCEAKLGRLTLLVGAAYFVVWTLLGAVVFVVGYGIATLQMQFTPLAKAVPFATGIIVLGAGALQFSQWKMHHLACCRRPLAPGIGLPAGTLTAWRHGLRLGLHCCCSCAGLTAILLVVGVMEPVVMLTVTVAISAERLAPQGERIAQITGGVSAGAGLFLVVQAVI